jgi:cytochrome c553
MGTFAKAMTDDEIREAAKYFGSMKFTPWIRVVETAKVAKHQLAGQVFVALSEDRTETLSPAVLLEVPENAEHFETYRDPRVGFVAYVVPGTLKKGETLATTGANGRTVRCATCHGEDLRGMGPIPAIAGRSPSYLARQLNDFRTGARRGAWSSLMKEATQKLTDDDILALSAYAASKAP